MDIVMISEFPETAVLGSTASSRSVALRSEEILTKITGRRPVHLDIPSLAGPNDTIQWLFESGVAWVALAIALGKPFFDELQKRAAGAFWEHIAELVKHRREAEARAPQVDWTLDEIAAICADAQAAGDAVIFGFRLPGGRERNIGIQLKGSTPEEVAGTIIALANFAPELEGRLGQMLKDNARFAQTNDDLSGKIALTDKGYTIVRMQLANAERSGEQIILRINPDGQMD
ncbi:MAG: hypothetical protein KF842_04055 [Caulobacter sp.]|nr:hypothetical protein [Caulobacter sp.]